MRTPATFDYDYFDNPAAQGYQGYTREAWADDPLPPWKEIARYCVAQQVKSVIDVGCAKGFLVSELLAVGIDACGFDVSDYALSFAAGLPCRKGDVRDGVRGNADAVIALGSLQYINEIELPAALTSIRRATHRLFLISAHYEGSRQVVPDPLRQITRSRDWWRERVRDAGFDLTDEREMMDVHKVIDAKQSG